MEAWGGISGPLGGDDEEWDKDRQQMAGAGLMVLTSEHEALESAGREGRSLGGDEPTLRELRLQRRQDAQQGWEDKFGCEAVNFAREQARQEMGRHNPRVWKHACQAVERLFLAGFKRGREWERVEGLSLGAEDADDAWRRQ